MSRTARRTTYAAIVALVSLAAPLLLWWLVAPHHEERWLVALIIVPVLGPLVFELLGHSRPRWTQGATFAVVMAVIAGLYAGIVLRLEQSGPGAASFIGGLMFVLVLVAGLVGAFIAWLIGASFSRDSGGQGARGLRPWHVGAVIAFADVVAVAAIAGVTA